MNISESTIISLLNQKRINSSRLANSRTH